LLGRFVLPDGNSTFRRRQVGRLGGGRHGVRLRLGRGLEGVIKILRRHKGHRRRRGSAQVAAGQEQRDADRAQQQQAVQDARPF
jgi:hypothetical protein